MPMLEVFVGVREETEKPTLQEFGMAWRQSVWLTRTGSLGMQGAGFVLLLTVWICTCACVSGLHSKKCQPMPASTYNLATVGEQVWRSGSILNLGISRSSKPDVKSGDLRAKMVRRGTPACELNAAGWVTRAVLG